VMRRARAPILNPISPSRGRHNPSFPPLQFHRDPLPPASRSISYAPRSKPIRRVRRDSSANGTKKVFQALSMS
jgi:hypothetical protein